MDDDALILLAEADTNSSSSFASFPLFVHHPTSHICFHQVIFERATFDSSETSAVEKHFSKFGVPVEAGQPVLVQHQATRQCLLGDAAQVEYTEFGAEHEVVFQTVIPTNMVSSLSGREAKGSSVVTVPLEKPTNHWVVVKED